MQRALWIAIAVAILPACARPRRAAELGPTAIHVDAGRGDGGVAYVNVTLRPERRGDDCPSLRALEITVNGTRLGEVSLGGTNAYAWLPGPGNRCLPIRALGALRPPTSSAVIGVRADDRRWLVAVDDLFGARSMRVDGVLVPGAHATAAVTPASDALRPRAAGSNAKELLAVELEPDGGDPRHSWRAPVDAVDGNRVGFVVPRAAAGSGRLSLHGQGASPYLYPAIARCEGATACVVALQVGVDELRVAVEIRAARR